MKKLKVFEQFKMEPIKNPGIYECPIDMGYDDNQRIGKWLQEMDEIIRNDDMKLTITGFKPVIPGGGFEITVKGPYSYIEEMVKKVMPYSDLEDVMSFAVKVG